MYAVQVRLDEDNVRGSVERIWQWFDREQIKPPTFRYRMTAAGVALCLDFQNLNDVAEFAEAFHGMVLGPAPA